MVRAPYWNQRIEATGFPLSDFILTEIELLVELPGDSRDHVLASPPKV